MEENGERGDGMDEERRMNAPEAQERSSFRKFKFFGSYDHSIDAKGRIIVPNAYRKALGESFTITVSEVRLSAGAGFIVVQTGSIMTMPGLPKVPAAEKIDVDSNGKITGLF